MNKVVWKYEIPLERHFKIDLPQNAKILSVQTQHGIPCMWVEFEPPEIEEKKDKRYFFIAETGEAFDDMELQYIATFQYRCGVLIYHLYEHIKKSF